MVFLIKRKKEKIKMMPKYHIFFGAIFSAILFFSGISFLNSFLFFLASVFIDVDHNIFYVYRKKDWNFKNAYRFYKKLPLKHKPVVHIFHTIEFIILILVLSYLWSSFIFIFLGIVLHSIIDIIIMLYEKRIIGREFSLLRYLLTNDKSKYL